MINSILFDLDGTLLDTLEDLHDSVNHILSSYSLPTRTLAEIRSFVGNGIPTLIRRSAPEGTSEEDLVKYTAEMKEWYSHHSRIKTKAYDGTPELLAYLKEKNIKTAVVTNKAENSAVTLCKEIFGDVFTVVIGDDDVHPLKPAPDNVFRAMEAIGADSETTLYVGDSEVDVQTAKNAGLKCAGVLWGFRDEEILKKHGADFIVPTPSDIKNLI